MAMSICGKNKVIDGSGSSCSDHSEIHEQATSEYNSSLLSAAAPNAGNYAAEYMLCSQKYLLWLGSAVEASLALASSTNFPFWLSCGNGNY